jgi:hypothetical protein
VARTHLKRSFALTLSCYSAGRFAHRT